MTDSILFVALLPTHLQNQSLLRVRPVSYFPASGHKPLHTPSHSGLIPTYLPDHHSASNHQIRFFSRTRRRRQNSSSPPSAQPGPTDSPSPNRLTHLTPSGTAHMVNISAKSPTHRTAVAVATVLFSNPSTFAALQSATLKKGDALAVARVAGIMAAKKTSELIPLAHPGIGITGVVVDVELVGPASASAAASSASPAAASASHDASQTAHETGAFGAVHITATVECAGATGVEMEALTAASVAGLTVYDMCKAVDRGMVMGAVRVVEKRGGRSGGWKWHAGTGRIVRVSEGSGEG